jgi:hypothetical protein
VECHIGPVERGVAATSSILAQERMMDVPERGAYGTQELFTGRK